MAHKECFTCKKLKALSCFSKNKLKKDGLDYMCRECRRTYDNMRYSVFNKPNKAKYYLANRARLLNGEHARARMVENRFRKLKYGASNRGFPMTLTLEQYADLVSHNCTYCDGSLPEAGGGLDRVDSEKGYVLNNVVPCCRLCNVMKGTLSTEDFFAHIRLILSNV